MSPKFASTSPHAALLPFSSESSQCWMQPSSYNSTLCERTSPDCRNCYGGCRLHSLIVDMCTLALSAPWFPCTAHTNTPLLLGVLSSSTLGRMHSPNSCPDLCSSSSLLLSLAQDDTGVPHLLPLCFVHTCVLAAILSICPGVYDTHLELIRAYL